MVFAENLQAVGDEEVRSQANIDGLGHGGSTFLAARGLGRIGLKQFGEMPGSDLDVFAGSCVGTRLITICWEFQFENDGLMNILRATVS